MKNLQRLVVALVFFFAFLFSSPIFPIKADLAQGQSLLLTNNSGDYTVENDFYKAIIPKPSAAGASGIVKHLYVKKSDGTWSNDLVYQGLTYYGLGYMEGAQPSDNNDNNSIGMQNTTNMTITIVENTPTRIQILSTCSGCSGLKANFNVLWTFWAKKPYFQSDATVIATSAYLTTQFQYCWMINGDLPALWYGTDKNGNIEQYTSRVIQQIQSPNINSYPWLNWQFTGENVSLGMMFTNIYDKYGVIGETGDQPFEYQLDFELGAGSLGSPVSNGYKREVNTVYYTSNSASNAPIQNFASAGYQGASTSSAQNPSLQAAYYATNSFGQNSGLSSAIVNSPYFLLRQNAQNMYTKTPEGPEYLTSIYGPLYGYQTELTSGNEDFADQLLYSLNYSNDSQTFTYGTVNSTNATNSNPLTSLTNGAISSDGKLAYSTTFNTWNDSDKLEITGSASNGSPNASVKSVYVSLSLPSPPTTTALATSATPAGAITTSLSGTDSLWTDYNYFYPSGIHSLIYLDNQEHVPPLSVPVNVQNGAYNVTAYVQQRGEGSITYSYSADNNNWNTFVVPQGGVGSVVYAVSLGVQNVANKVFYIGDDGSASSGIAGWAGWDYLTFTPVSLPSIQSLGSNVYDLQLNDLIYGKTGIGIKVISPTSNVTLTNSNGQLNVYLYSQASAQALTTFNYPFDIYIYPHSGWLNSPSDFTDLHSQNVINYSSHKFYIPLVLQSGRTNTIYSDGSISYSSDPANSSSEINMTALPSTGSLNLTINSWGNVYNWTETASDQNTTTTHTIDSLSPNTSYTIELDGAQYSVLTSDVGGNIAFTYSGGNSTHTFNMYKTYSQASTPVCTDSPPVSSPNLIRVTRNGTDATLYFLPVNGVETYFIAYSKNSTAEDYGVEYNIGSSVDLQKYTIHLLNSKSIYFFKVRGGNGCAPGPWSNVVSAGLLSSPIATPTINVHPVLQTPTKPMSQKISTSGANPKSNQSIFVQVVEFFRKLFSKIFTLDF